MLIIIVIFSSIALWTQKKAVLVILRILLWVGPRAMKDQIKYVFGQIVRYQLLCNELRWLCLWDADSNAFLPVSQRDQKW